jgi:hypothetical protein
MLSYSEKHLRRFRIERLAARTSLAQKVIATGNTEVVTSFHLLLSVF